MKSRGDEKPCSRMKPLTPSLSFSTIWYPCSMAPVQTCVVCAPSSMNCGVLAGLDAAHAADRNARLGTRDLHHVAKRDRPHRLAQ